MEHISKIFSYTDKMLEENDATSIQDLPPPNNPEMVVGVPKKAERIYIDPYYAHYVLV